VWHHRAEPAFSSAPAAPASAAGIVPPPEPPAGLRQPAGPRAPRRRPRKGGGWAVLGIVVAVAVWGIGHASDDDDDSPAPAVSQAVDAGDEPGDDAGGALLDDPGDDDGGGAGDADIQTPDTAGAHSLVLRVAGDFPDVDIDYTVGDQDGWAYYSSAPWSQQLAYDGTSSVYVDVAFFVDQGETQPLTCTISVDGAVVATQTVDPDQAFVDCEYSPGG
jgi:hypothetical protein